MKKLLLVCCFVIGISAVSHAQGGRRSPEEMTSALKTSLTLTDDQATKVKAVYDVRAKSVDSLMTAANGDRAVMMSGFMKLTETTNTKIKAILTAEQAATFQKQADAQAAAMKARMQGN
jgi:protein CpxP